MTMDLTILAKFLLSFANKNDTNKQKMQALIEKIAEKEKLTEELKELSREYVTEKIIDIRTSHILQQFNEQCDQTEKLSDELKKFRDEFYATVQMVQSVEWKKVPAYDLVMRNLKCEEELKEMKLLAERERICNEKLENRFLVKELRELQNRLSDVKKKSEDIESAAKKHMSTVRNEFVAGLNERNSYIIDFVKTVKDIQQIQHQVESDDSAKKSNKLSESGLKPVQEPASHVAEPLISDSRNKTATIDSMTQPSPLSKFERFDLKNLNLPDFKELLETNMQHEPRGDNQRPKQHDSLNEKKLENINQLRNSFSEVNISEPNEISNTTTKTGILRCESIDSKSLKVPVMGHILNDKIHLNESGTQRTTLQTSKATIEVEKLAMCKKTVQFVMPDNRESYEKNIISNTDISNLSTDDISTVGFEPQFGNYSQFEQKYMREPSDIEMEDNSQMGYMPSFNNKETLKEPGIVAPIHQVEKVKILENRVLRQAKVGAEITTFGSKGTELKTHAENDGFCSAENIDIQFQKQKLQSNASLSKSNDYEHNNTKNQALNKFPRSPRFFADRSSYESDEIDESTSTTGKAQNLKKTEGYFNNAPNRDRMGDTKNQDLQSEQSQLGNFTTETNQTKKSNSNDDFGFNDSPINKNIASDSSIAFSDMDFDTSPMKFGNGANGSKFDEDSTNDDEATSLQNFL